MNKNRIEVIVNVVPVGDKFQAQAQIRYIHDTVIQKTIEAKGPILDTSEEAHLNKGVIEKTIKETLVKVRKKIPTAKVFKHEFE